ncbi:galactose mutarotase [Synechococcus sp. ATX 2A4]|uniref:aldose epimerase family protein n=1 Tax=Synechococcus sp. ATX 2A4 TaxID=2823727 RepID=UPI0020CFC108|nr:galactose mutarotase [Synechococcus sp. ATX 2A4]MCP9885717.1 galactose mutarotase [Synechococcus sp. ATX 2A4]
MPLLQRQRPYPHWEFSAPVSSDAPGSPDLLRLVPERGGLLTGWRCHGRELLYLDADRFADPALSVRGGMPVLFPICGNLPGDQLPLPEGSFTLRQHGFARDLPWQLRALPQEAGVELELCDSPATLAAFPFPFRLRLQLRLEPSALAITAVLENSGSRPLPFSFGLHPYFNVSALPEAESGSAAVHLEGLPERCFNYLVMAEADTAATLAQLAAGVDFLARPEGPVRLVDPAAGMALELHPSAPFDLAVVWTDPPRPMVCLEPWTGPRGALVSGDRRLEVAAGESCTLRSRYALRPL